MAKDGKPRKKPVLRWFFIVGLVATLGITWFVQSVFSPDSPANRASAIRCTLEWGRLAPFPTSARELTTTIEGSAFTRSFRVNFVAPPAEIEQWLQQSPGTRSVTPKTPSPGIRNFEITPGGGAVWADVTVDDITHRVAVYVCWS